MRTLFDRIEDNVSPEPNSGCWLWTGRITNGGYAQIWTERRRKMVHRITYEQKYGAIPEGLDLDHLCRVRCCVNPDHLEPVTRRENIRRGISHIAAQMRQTTCIKGHELSTRYDKKRGWFRFCKVCHKLEQRIYYQREDVRERQKAYCRQYCRNNKEKWSRK
jgi:hypothetical protein